MKFDHHDSQAQENHEKQFGKINLAYFCSSQKQFREKKMHTTRETSLDLLFQYLLILGISFESNGVFLSR